MTLLDNIFIIVFIFTVESVVIIAISFRSIISIIVVLFIIAAAAVVAVRVIAS